MSNRDFNEKSGFSEPVRIENSDYNVKSDSGEQSEYVVESKNHVKKNTRRHIVADEPKAPVIETKNYRKPKMPKKKKIAIAASAFAAFLCLCAVAFWFLHPHQFEEWRLTKAPTCTEVGEETGTCFCGEIGTRTVEIDSANGHKEIIDKGYGATKTENGLTDGSHCEYCGEIFKEQTIIYATGSQGFEYTILTDKTCEITGIGTCTDTELFISQYIDGYEVTSIGEDAFENCSSLTSIVIPNSVTNIGNDAFRYCTNLTSIMIPEGVTHIGDYAFGSCSNLTSVSIPNGVTNIGMYTFFSCKSLTSIVIPEGLTSTGVGTFTNCKNLASIVIPNSVTNIGAHTFHSCSELTEITYGGTISEWENLPKGTYWDETTPDYTVYCTDGTIAKNGTTTYY